MLLVILLAGLSTILLAQTIIMDNTDNLGNAIDEIGSFWDEDITLIVLLEQDIPVLRK